MNHNLLFIIGALVILLVMLAVDNQNKDILTQSDLNNYGQKEKNQTHFQYLSNFGYYGTLNLKGYVEIKQKESFGGEVMNYAFFHFVETDNDLIYNFLEESKGNLFIDNASIGLGCYEKDKKRIYSISSGDDDDVENVIKDAQLEKLLSSNKANLVSLQIEKPINTQAKGAPACYSHFRSFKLIENNE